MAISRRAVSANFGFQVPESFVQLLEISRTVDLYEALYTTLGSDISQFVDPDLHDHSIVGQHTWQPEFFEFLRPGEDGIGQGFVIHAPELSQDEWPIFEHDPSGFNGDMVFLGRTLREALEMLVARDPVYAGRDTDLRENPQYVALATAFDLSLERKTLFRRIKFADCYVPHVPAGWRFEPAADMIGALAPAELFADEQPFVHLFHERFGLDRPAAHAAMFEQVKHLLHDGFMGSALVGVRRLYRDNLRDPAGTPPRQYLELWAEIYAALERPLLEKAVCDRLQIETDS